MAIAVVTLACVAADASAFYNPSVGRWISRDSARSDLNLYEYGSCNPTRNTDPLGLYIIAIGGAARTGDDEFKGTVAAIAKIEQAWYRQNQPNTFPVNKEGYTFISAPTGEGLIGGFGFPDWKAAQDKLNKVVEGYELYRRSLAALNVITRLAGTPCELKPEYLHIVGFSDGATTIALWQRNSAAFQQDPYGLIMVIDLVRRGNTDGGQAVLGDLPNLWTHTELNVPTTSNATVFAAIAHQTPAWALWSAQAGWTGHKLVGGKWEGNMLVQDNKKHSEFPGSQTVRDEFNMQLMEALKRLKQSK